MAYRYISAKYRGGDIIKGVLLIHLHTIFSEQYNICCPVKTIRAQVARRDKPWITNGLKNACRKKNRLYKIWLHSQTPAAESR